jgi:hypothetical protein
VNLELKLIVLEKIIFNVIQIVSLTVTSMMFIAIIVLILYVPLNVNLIAHKDKQIVMIVPTTNVILTVLIFVNSVFKLAVWIAHIGYVINTVNTIAI